MSDASTREVVDLIRLVRPQVVFVELDSTRAAHLRRRNSGGAPGANNDNAAGAPSSTPLDPSSILPSFLPPQLAQMGSLSSFGPILKSIPDLLKRIGWLPQQGGEMKAALDEADRLGARCVHGDVEFGETMSELRTAVANAMSDPSRFASVIASAPPPPGELAGAFGSLLSGRSGPSQFVEEIKTRDRAVQMTEYLRRCFPEVYRVVVARRDVHMARMLREHCSEGKVVAVVGMAHVEGIEREWEGLDAKRV